MTQGPGVGLFGFLYPVCVCAVCGTLGILSVGVALHQSFGPPAPPLGTLAIWYVEATAVGAALATLIGWLGDRYRQEAGEAAEW